MQLTWTRQLHSVNLPSLNNRAPDREFAIGRFNRANRDLNAIVPFEIWTGTQSGFECNRAIGQTKQIGPIGILEQSGPWCTSVHISTHQYTSVHIVHTSTHQYTSVHINTHQTHIRNTSVHISTHQYASRHISTHQFTSVHISKIQIHTSAHQDTEAIGN